MHRGCAHKLYATKEMHSYSAACSLINVFAPSCPCFRSTRLILTGKTVCCLCRLRVHIPTAAGAIQAVLHAHVLPLLTSHKKHKLTHHRKGTTRQCIPNLAVGKSLHLYIAQSTSHANRFGILLHCSHPCHTQCTSKHAATMKETQNHLKAIHFHQQLA